MRKSSESSLKAREIKKKKNDEGGEGKGGDDRQQKGRIERRKLNRWEERNNRTSVPYLI